MTEFDCCAGAKWLAVADLGSALSVDFILGRCDGCSGYWMHLWSPMAPGSRYVPVTGDNAWRLMALPAGTARKRALAEWFEAP